MGKTRKIIVNCGTDNKVKVKAVKLAFSEFYNVEVNKINVPSKVASQPISMDEIVKGAKNRAIAAFRAKKCDYSVGYEAGIFPFPNRTGYFDTGICVIFDGKEFYYGGSPIFEYPKFIIKGVLEQKKEVGKIMDEYLGTVDIKKHGGVIGYLSENKIKRSHYVKIAVLMALISLRKKELY